MTDVPTPPPDTPPAPRVAPELEKILVRPAVAADRAIAAGIGAIAVGIIGWAAAGTGRVDLAQWIMAGASLMTLVAAVVAGIYAAGAFRLEADREQRRIESDRQEQARLVAAWPLGVDLGLIQVGDQQDTGPVGVRVHVRNFWLLPVTNVNVSVVVTMFEVANGERVPGGREESWVFGRWEEALIPPTYDQQHVVKPMRPPIRPEDFGLSSAVVDYSAAVGIEFVDSTNVSWVRTPEGVLHERPGSSATRRRR